MRNFIKSFLISTSFCLAVSGQILDQDCRPIPPPPACQQIVDQIADREDFYAMELNRLREMRVRPSERRAHQQRIRNLERQRDQELARLRADLQRCREQNNTVPRRQEAPTALDAVFAGTVTARTSDPQIRGPFTRNITVGLRFSRNRCVVEITSFPAISFLTDPLPIVGRLTITVAQIGGGTGQFFPVSGQMNMPLRLNADVPVINDSQASSTLTTGTSTSLRGTFTVTGSPLTRTNNAALESCGQTVNGVPIQCPITLAGVTVFENGRLDDDEGSIVIAGNITVPRPEPPPDSPRQQCLERCEREYDQCRERPVRPPQEPPNCRALRNACERRCPN